MENIVYLDTHVIAWIYAGEKQRFSQTAIDSLESSALKISPMVELELQYLYEIDRITVPPLEILQFCAIEFGIHKCLHPLQEIVTKALHIDWTRDPFDRIVVAQAAIDSSELLTKDKSILTHYPHAFWD